MDKQLRQAAPARPTQALIIVAALLMVAGCAGAAEQSGAEQFPADEIPTADFAGTWQGSFTLNMGGGEVLFVLKPEGNSYFGETTVTFEGESMFGTIYQQEFKGNASSFWVSLDEYEVRVKGTLEGNRISGTIELYAQGEFADTGTFVVNRRAASSD